MHTVPATRAGDLINARDFARGTLSFSGSHSVECNMDMVWFPFFIYTEMKSVFPQDVVDTLLLS